MSYIKILAYTIVPFCLFHCEREDTHADVVQICVGSIGGGRSCGTGSFIFDEGVISTANHVVDNAVAHSVVARTYDNRQITLQSTVYPFIQDEIYDIAFLEGGADHSPSGYPEPCEITEAGDLVKVIGFPAGEDGVPRYKETEGLVISYEDVGMYIYTTAEVNFGNSGSPIINESRGCISGMITHMFLNDGFGPSIDEMERVYERNI